MTEVEANARGLAWRVYGISNDVHDWRFRGKIYRTETIPMLENDAPPIMLASFADVIEAQL